MKNSPLNFNGILRSVLILSTVLFSNQLFTQCQIGDDIDGKLPNYQAGHAVSMPDEYTIALGMPYGDIQGQRGEVRVNELVNGQWNQKGQTLFGDAMGDEFGYSVSMPDANTIAVGARYFAHPAAPPGFRYDGLVRIYLYNGSQWIQKGQDLLAQNIIDIQAFGYSVSMPDANTVAIGAPNELVGYADTTGFVDVYSYNGSQWVQLGSTIHGDPKSDFGISVSMPNSTTVAVGCERNKNGSGAFIPSYARVFVFDGSNWNQKGPDLLGTLVGGSTDGFGTSVSMPDENTIAVGIPYYYNTSINRFTGATRIFHFKNAPPNGYWIQKGQDIIASNNPLISSAGGYSVSMPDKNTVGIGGKFGRYVRVLRFRGGGWVQDFQIDEEASLDFIGRSVSMPNRNTIGIGAPQNDGAGTSAGHARIFDLRNAQLPYIQNFDGSQGLDEECYWTWGSTSKGFVKVTNTPSPCGGTEDLLLCSNYQPQTGPEISFAELHIDLSTTYDPITQDLFLTITHGKGIHFSSDANDGIFISDDGGATYLKITNFLELPAYVFDCQVQTIKLNHLMTYLGMSFDENFVIKFSQETIAPYPGDGVAIDEVKVEAVNKSPFQRNFNKSNFDDLVNVYARSDDNYISVDMPVEMTTHGCKIILSDVSGRVLTKTRSASFQTELRIPTTEFANGIYFMKFEYDGKWFNKKVFINN